MNLIVIIREANLKDRIRLSKIIDYLKGIDNVDFELWKKQGDEVLDFKYRDIISTCRNKKVEYIKWIYRLLIESFMARKTIYFVSGFESAIVICFKSFFIETKYIFDNPDNFYQSKKFPKLLGNLFFKLERIVIKRSIVTLVPDESRISGYDLTRTKFEIIKNFPSKQDISISACNLDLKHKKSLVVYINGWLVKTRGLDMISSFINRLDSNLDLEIIIAGKKEGLGDILKSKYVSYKGVVSSIESLSYYYISDVILTFYDPSYEINRKACPNKWGDAILTNTIPILNYGIDTIKDYFPNGGFLLVNYDNPIELYELIMKIYNDKTILTNKLRELESSPKYYWEDEMDKIFKLIEC